MIWRYQAVAVNPQPFVAYVYRVNDLLRRIHGMGRLASEWYCFRRMGYIGKAFATNTTHAQVAEALSKEWPNSPEQRDYAAMRLPDDK
jgi:hypothetical protein